MKANAPESSSSNEKLILQAYSLVWTVLPGWDSQKKPEKQKIDSVFWQLKFYQWIGWQIELITNKFKVLVFINRKSFVVERIEIDWELLGLPPDDRGERNSLTIWQESEQKELINMVAMLTRKILEVEGEVRSLNASLNARTEKTYT